MSNGKTVYVGIAFTAIEGNLHVYAATTFENHVADDPNHVEGSAAKEAVWARVSSPAEDLVQTRVIALDVPAVEDYEKGRMKETIEDSRKIGMRTLCIHVAIAQTENDVFAAAAPEGDGETEILRNASLVGLNERKHGNVLCRRDVRLIIPVPHVPELVTFHLM